MIQTEEREIDGQVFQVAGLDLRTERAVFVKLTKLLGPAIVTFVENGKAPAPAIGKLLEVIDNADLDYLVETFSKVTKIPVETASKSGQSWLPVMDSAFKNGIGSQMKWLWFCLEHQYASFLGGDGTTFLQELQAKVSR